METIKCKERGNIGYITFNRPGVGNAINYQMAEELAAWMNNFILSNERSGLTVLILAGSCNNFMYGADISAFTKGPKYVDEFTTNARHFMRMLTAIPPVSIAVVEGYALGGGLEVALSCDYIIASESAKLGLPEINFGLIPGAGGTQLLPQKIGYYKSTEMILTGGTIDAQQAKEYGLVDEVAIQDELMQTALFLGRQTEFNKRSFKAFDQAPAELSIMNTAKSLEGITSNKPKYAIDAAIKCLRASINSPDFITESKCFEECLRREETQSRIKSFLKRNFKF